MWFLGGYKYIRFSYYMEVFNIAKDKNNMLINDQINVPQAVQRMLKDFYLIYRPTDVKVSFETADITTYE